MSIPENMKVFVPPFWIPQMHESSIGTRFIIENKQCVIKHLSKKT